MSRADDGDERDTVAERKRPSKDPLPATRAAADEDFAESLPRWTPAGRYVLLTRLGAGGAGLVYSAYDPQLDRKVAIKLLRALDDEGSDASQGRARLLREAQAMARLKHPNILPVYDVGTLEHAMGSRVFMAMELVEGGTLRAWLRQRHSRREILDVMIACGRGLAAAHAAGLVHRDFKPDNVLIDRDGRVFVTDFGLVRAATQGESESAPLGATSPPSALSSPLTAMNTVMGTPGYMAPEQYQAQPIDARTDQFSFCLTLCEALCGKRLVAGRSMKELEAATVDGKYADAMREAKVPSWLSRVIVRGLARERDARYPSMTALLAALGNDPAKRVRRIAVAVAAVALVGGTAFGIQRLGNHREELCGGGDKQLGGVWVATVRERVRQAFERAHMAPRFEILSATLDAYTRDFAIQHREACEATRVRGEQPENVLGLRMSCLDMRRKELAALSSLLVDADRATALDAVQLASKLTSIRSCGDIAALTARVPPPADPVARGMVDSLRANLATSKVLADAAHYPAARTIVDEVLRAEAALHYGPVRAAALEQLARLQREQGEDMKTARVSLVDAVYAAYASHDDERVASAMTDLAMLDAYWLGEHESGERWIHLAQAAIQRLGGSDELEAERGRVEAEIWIGEDKGALAVAAAEPALRLADKVYGPSTVQAASFHATLGAAYSTNGNEALAREHYEAQHAILLKLVGPEHPLVAMALNNLGLNAAAEDRFDDAERYYRSSVSLLEKTFGADHPRVAIALTNLGAALRSHDKPAEALDAFQLALAINESHFGPDYGDSLYALLGIGESLLALNRPSDALPWIERALHLAESGEPSEWGVAEARFALAQALWASGGDRKRARTLAVSARAGMAVEHNAVARKQLAEIDAWIARHR
ncbi:MAG TPA: serine/threonine-protein kinase [Kofleriaceae bacterium]